MRRRQPSPIRPLAAVLPLALAACVARPASQPVTIIVAGQHPVEVEADGAGDEVEVGWQGAPGAWQGAPGAWQGDPGAWVAMGDGDHWNRPWFRDRNNQRAPLA